MKDTENIFVVQGKISSSTTKVFSVFSVLPRVLREELLLSQPQIRHPIARP